MTEPSALNKTAVGQKQQTAVSHGALSDNVSGAVWKLDSSVLLNAYAIQYQLDKRLKLLNLWEADEESYWRTAFADAQARGACHNPASGKCALLDVGAAYGAAARRRSATRLQASWLLGMLSGSDADGRTTPARGAARMRARRLLQHSHAAACACGAGRCALLRGQAATLANCTLPPQ